MTTKRPTIDQWNDAIARAKERDDFDELARLEIAKLDDILRASTKPYARIHEGPTSSGSKGAIPAELALWASKGGDRRAYLPRDVPWPKRDGEPMLPVIQIDFADVPPLPDFPPEGMLSIFWTHDYCAEKVFYFPEIIRDPAQLHADFPTFDSSLYPFVDPTALSFERCEGCVAWGDYRFEELFGEAAVAELHDSESFDELWAHVYERSGSAHDRLGGYASPQQSDPRESEKYRRYETLLLQLENDNFTHCFFIEPAALARRDFSDVLHYNACD